VACDLRGVLAEDGLSVGIASPQANAASFSQVDCRIDSHNAVWDGALRDQEARLT
jgi:hypothetical protein